MAVQPDGSLTAGLDVEPASGQADSGNLNDDLADVFQAVGEAAEDRATGVIFLLDEIQFLSKIELEALIGAVHRTVQRQLPITFAGAGLPQLPGLAGDAKSYAERLFRFPIIGELPRSDAEEALVQPARAEGVEYSDAAVDQIVRYTEGYPYFIQEFGRAVWNLAAGPTIVEADALAAISVVEDDFGGFVPFAAKAGDSCVFKGHGPEPQSNRDAWVYNVSSKQVSLSMKTSSFGLQ